MPRKKIHKLQKNTARLLPQNEWNNLNVIGASEHKSPTWNHEKQFRPPKVSDIIPFRMSHANIRTSSIEIKWTLK